MWILGRESERAARRARQHCETRKEAAAADTALTVPVLLRSVEAACTYIPYVVLYVHSAVNPKTLVNAYVLWGQHLSLKNQRMGAKWIPLNPNRIQRMDHVSDGDFKA